MLHVYQQFQAAGHGTFFTGFLKNNNNAENFSWIYDCGSNRPTCIENLVDNYLSWSLAKGDIDLVILSHFDKDHVNGIERLLKSKKVKTLALPYIGFRKRLEIASEGILSSEAAMFALDPIGYLNLTGLSGQVGSLIFVRGGGGYDDSAEPYFLPDHDQPNPDFPRDDNYSFEDPEYVPVIPGHRGNSTFPTNVLSHQKPVKNRQLPWEFIFYNVVPDDDGKIKSGKTIEQIRDEVAEILRLHGVLTSFVHDDWRVKLRKCYDKHFGTSGPQRNDLSLCVMARPDCDVALQYCRKFNADVQQGNDEMLPFDTKSALLLTGDLSMSLDRSLEMSRHFGHSRWKDVGVMQIPHHGSAHSWKPGTAHGCHHEHSVLCVSGESTTKPHLDVQIDLENHGPVEANCSTSVTWCFHFNHP